MGTKISALPIATTPTGAELVPIVQGGVTKSTTVSGSFAGASRTRGVVYVEDFGADPTGVADSGVAFRLACSWALTNGGGVINALGAAYLFTTWDTVSFFSTNNLALFCLPGNTELAGGGVTRLIFSAIARAGIYNNNANRSHWIGFRAGQTGQYVHDFQFDAAGVLGQSGTDSLYLVRTMSGDCLLERLKCSQAPLRNAIADSSETSATAPVIVRDCELFDNGPNMTGNSGISTDYSALYLEAPGSLAEGNQIYNTAVAAGNCGGIEMHAARYTMRNNYIKHMWPAAYIGAGSAVTTTDALVESNYIGYNRTGIEIIDPHVGLKIVNNYFEGNLTSGQSGSFVDIFTPLASVTGVTSAGIQSGMIVSGNIFDETNYTSGSARPTSVSSIAVAISALQGGIISNNIFISPVTAVSMQGTITADTKNVLIAENVCVGVVDWTGAFVTGVFAVLGDSSAGWGAGPVFSDIVIRDNLMVRSRALSAASKVTGGLFTGGGSFTATFTNIHYESNTIVNLVKGLTGGAAASVYKNNIPALTIASANTIAPVGEITFISGVAAIETITVPTSIVDNGTGKIVFIPTGVFTTVNTGNIAIASTAVVGKALTMIYDTGTSKWYPSY